MELKSKELLKKGSLIKSSNRTFMELKFLAIPSAIIGFHGSNRTFMELKFRQAMSDQHPPLVLIVPLWN